MGEAAKPGPEMTENHYDRRNYFLGLRVSTALVLIILVIGEAGVSASDDYPLSLSLGVGLNTLNGGAPPWFGIRPQFQLRADTYLWRNWRAEVMFTKFKLYDDIDNNSEFSLITEENERTRAWKGFDVGLMAKRRFYPFGDRLSLSAGLGGGISVWEMADPAVDTVLQTTGPHGGVTSFDGTELFLSGALGIEKQIHRFWRVGFDVQVNYLTGVGLAFDEAVSDALGRWNLKAGISLSLLFGGKDDDTYSFEPVSFSRPSVVRQEQIRPADVVFVPPDYPREYAIVESSSAVDSDRDGVPDLQDDCPDTPLSAAGLIDVRGCPIDSDADGVPDYRDRCPDNLIGAVVDQSGCPYDSDHDGVPDGLDDCPETDPGMQVDKYGCIDVAALKTKITLNINYRPGSFELDYKTGPILDSLVMILKKAPNITVEVNAYTDNTGTFGENKSISQRRANRIRDYLVERGISRERVVPVGRGEVNFVASNNTEGGRQQNRRVELVFYK